jgi:antitoxin VapB
MNKITTAKLFMHGRSQAVRLPKEFRMEGKEVNIRKEGNSVVIEPVRQRKSLEEVFAYIDSLPGDAYEEGWRQQPDWPTTKKKKSM